MCSLWACFSKRNFCKVFKLEQESCWEQRRKRKLFVLPRYRHSPISRRPACRVRPSARDLAGFLILVPFTWRQRRMPCVWGRQFPAVHHDKSLWRRSEELNFLTANILLGFFGFIQQNSTSLWVIMYETVIIQVSMLIFIRISQAVSFIRFL